MSDMLYPVRKKGIFGTKIVENLLIYLSQSCYSIIDKTGIDTSAAIALSLKQFKPVEIAFC